MCEEVKIPRPPRRAQSSTAPAAVPVWLDLDFHAGGQKIQAQRPNAPNYSEAMFIIGDMHKL